MSHKIDISAMIGGACGAGGYLLDERKWAVRTFKHIGPVRIRNRSEEHMDGLFPGQLLLGVTETGSLIGIDVTEDGALVPRRR